MKMVNRERMVIGEPIFQPMTRMGKGERGIQKV
jgi:hypothetical protein